MCIRDSLTGDYAVMESSSVLERVMDNLSPEHRRFILEVVERPASSDPPVSARPHQFKPRKSPPRLRLAGEYSEQSAFTAQAGTAVHEPSSLAQQFNAARARIVQVQRRHASVLTATTHPVSAPQVQHERPAMVALSAFSPGAVPTPPSNSRLFATPPPVAAAPEPALDTLEPSAQCAGLQAGTPQASELTQNQLLWLHENDAGPSAQQHRQSPPALWQQKEQHMSTQRLQHMSTKQYQQQQQERIREGAGSLARCLAALIPPSKKHVTGSSLLGALAGTEHQRFAEWCLTVKGTPQTEFAYGDLFSAAAQYMASVPKAH
eukprot:TRINITY_DN4514_c0_g1_i1.p1 TRINITY_DN4514_c0_g1~~TRINITY_DN4514_c0_g1_i1.p1  ORF type:complete len:320 (-),score=46.55 TRINITY_DN4514_c0_g1_i1:251-1210(-)